MDTKQTVHLWKSRSQEHFHRWSDHYDKDIINVLLFYPSFRRVAERLRHWRRRGRGKFRVLDIGCGTGNLAFYCLDLVKAVEEFVGLDMSESMIAKARQKHDDHGRDKTVSFVVGDAEHLPFPDNSFNIITCCNSFHHYPHPQQAVNEMHRVLEKDGQVIIIDGSRDDPWGNFIFEFCVSFVESHVHHCTARKFGQLLDKAGFCEIKQRVFGVCPPVIINTARANKP